MIQQPCPLMVLNPPNPPLQAPKLFALNRMVEVLLYNIGRIYDLWAIFLRCLGLAHLFVEALIRALQLVPTLLMLLLRCPAQPPTPSYPHSTPTPTQPLQPRAGGDERPQASGAGGCH